MPCVRMGKKVYTAASGSCEWVRKAKGSCYGGNERKHLSMNSYEHKSVRDMMDMTLREGIRTSFSIFGNERKKVKERKKGFFYF